MKIVKALKLDKYSNSERYTQYDGFIYRDVIGGVGGKMGMKSEPIYCVALYTELEDGENTQYPLEDILDKYYVNCTEEIEEKEEDGKHIFMFEVESEDVGNITTIVGLVGRRVYNYQEGNYIKLGIE